MNDREAFEKWAQGKRLLINIREEMMYAAGGYINVKEMAWEAWQAALQAQAEIDAKAAKAQSEALDRMVWGD